MKSTHKSNQRQPTALKCWQDCVAFQLWGHGKQLWFPSLNADGETLDWFCWCSGGWILMGKPLRTSTAVLIDAAVSSRYWLQTDLFICCLLPFLHFLSQITALSSTWWPNLQIGFFVHSPTTQVRKSQFHLLFSGLTATFQVLLFPSGQFLEVLIGFAFGHN